MGRSPGSAGCSGRRRESWGWAECRPRATWTCAASGLIPARFRTSTSRTPDHSALPTAPFSQPTPGMIGAKNPRPFPEHWRTAGKRTVSSPFRSSSENVRGLSTRPSTSSVQGDSPSAGGPKWLLTKNRRLGVRNRSKTSTGVSASSGRVDRTINSGSARWNVAPTASFEPATQGMVEAARVR